MSIRIGPKEEFTFDVSGCNSVCKIGRDLFIAINQTGGDGNLVRLQLDEEEELEEIAQESFSYHIKSLTTDGNLLFGIREEDNPRRVQAFDPVNLRAIGSSYNMGEDIYGNIHASTAGFITAQEDMATGTAFDNTRLLRFDGAGFSEIKRIQARPILDNIGLRLLSFKIDGSEMGEYIELGGDRSVETRVELPLVSGSDVESKGGCLIGESRAVLAEEDRIVLYSVPEGEILDHLAIDLSGMGKMVTDGRYVYVVNEGSPVISAYDTYDDEVRLADTSELVSEDLGIAGVSTMGIAYGDNMVFVLSETAIGSFTKALGADFEISNPTPAVGETVTFRVI